MCCGGCPNPYGRCYTYHEALHGALEVLELLIEDYTARGKPLPQPHTLEHLTLSSLTE